MREATVGLIGAFIAERPYLTIGVLASGLTALGVVGAGAASGGAGEAIALVALISTAMLIAPMALAALAPRDGLRLALFTALIVLAGAFFVALDAQTITMPVKLPAPPLAVTLASVAYFTFLVALAPIARNVTRIGFLASFGAVLGVAGASGYLALEGLLGAPSGAIAVALALTVGVGAGVNAAADFSNFFTEGENRRCAAAAAGHSAVASAAFALMMLFLFHVIYSFTIEAWQFDWRLIWAGFTVGAASVATGLVAVVGGLVLSNINERAALGENRRRQWFAAHWRPLRMALPPTTAIAVAAIACILVVIAAFEVGIIAPLRFGILIIGVGIGSAFAFVSARTSVLIVLILTASAVLADYALTLFGVMPPAIEDRFAALTLGAVALGALTVSWRDARDTWRNTRDIVENALSDGLRRYLFIVGAGAASIFTAMHALQWQGALSALIYFLTFALIGLILAPPAMTAMSARLRRN